ncbi:uncharacterized protein LOC134338735 [Mobula hypostoma]|uniref:uncharacterized protein LOC134338735 n=1 Tax=Mobula hypostoma TaxID=723540 RepID=UPI002FC318E0
MTFLITPSATDYYTCVVAVYVLGHWEYSEHSDRMNVSIIDRPRKPTISTNWNGNALLKGETIQLKCETESQYYVRNFALYKGKDGHLEKSIRVDFGYNTVAFETSVNHSEIYWCAYQAVISGHMIDSERSRSLYVPVVGPLKKPEIFLNENFPIYIKGEMLLLTCKAPVRGPNRTFHIYSVNKTFPNTTSRIIEGTLSVTLDLTGVLHAGKEIYRCLYKTMVRGRQIDSEQSDPLVISVTDRPLKPIIALESDDPMTGREQNRSVRCTAPQHYTVNKFYLYTNYGKQSYKYSKSNGLHSATFNLTEPLLNWNVEYLTCQYEVWISGRSIVSEISDRLFFIRSDSIFEWHSWQFMLSVGAAVLLFMIAVLVSVTVARKKRGKCAFSDSQSE